MTRFECSIGPMQTYLVGGAVRDALLGLDVTDRDWVVVGETPDSMGAQGFRPVGKDFPVFLHPDTHEEYALARTERKSGPGYQGFSFNTSPSVTLEEDLMRRDLTINAIAQDKHGALVDPFNGAADLEARMLRHVSEAFVEDPVRILRVARFLARFAPLGFTIADETLALMRAMVHSGEVEHLVAERVWQELHRALLTESPRHFIEALRHCEALERVMPEINALFGVPQPEEHHPEVDAGIHTLMVLEETCRTSTDSDLRFAALCHDLGKGSTDPALWPAHHGHEERGAELAEQLCERLRAPRRTRELAVLIARWHTHVHRAMELRPATLLKLLQAMDPIRRPDRVEALILVCTADARGRLGKHAEPYPQADYLRRAVRAYANVDAAQLAASVANKSDIPSVLRDARLAALSGVKA